MFVPLALLLGLEAGVLLLLVAPVTVVRKGGLAVVGFCGRTAGSLVAKTLGFALAVLLVFSLLSIRRLRQRVLQASPFAAGGGGVSADRHELLEEMLEASMMAYSLLLALGIQALHSTMRERDSCRVSVAVLKKQAKGLETEYLRLSKESADGAQGGGGAAGDEREKGLRARIDELRGENENLRDEAAARAKDAKNAEASVQAIKKQTEGLRIEFDRLLDENDSLREQLSSFDSKYSKTDAKKKS